MKNYSNITLQEISELEQLSSRSYNACFKAKLLTLEAILHHFEKHLTFKNLPHCGEKLNTELITLCQKYQSPDAIAPAELKQQLTRITAQQILVVAQKKLVDAYIQILFTPLTSNTRKIVSLLQINRFGIFKAEERINKIQLRHLSPGNRAVVHKELSRVKNNIRSFIHFLQTCTDENFQLLYLGEIIKVFHPLKDDLVWTIFQAAIQDNKIALFRFLAILTSSELFFRPNEKILFEHLYHINGRSAEACCKALCIPPKKFRKLVYYLEQRLPRTFSFIEHCKLDQFTFHGIDYISPLIIFNQKFSIQNNLRYNLKFNTKFYFTILSPLCAHTHALCGFRKTGEENILAEPYYLIDNQFNSIFNFEGYLSYIEDLLQSIRFSREEFDFEQTLFPYFYQGYENHFADLKTICKQLLFHEFNIFVTSTGTITLSANAANTLHHFVYNALNVLGKMSTPTMILEQMQQISPNIIVTEKKIIRILKQHTGTFFSLSHPLHYGIKTWDTAKKEVNSPPKKRVR